MRFDIRDYDSMTVTFKNTMEPFWQVVRLENNCAIR
jgi:hypothetical protein